jgi:hypothetical protein
VAVEEQRVLASLEQLREPDQTRRIRVGVPLLKDVILWHRTAGR